MKNYKLTLCYEGSRYQGWQKQGNTDNTIQGKLETLLSRLLGQPVELQGSGRTDAGVHARRQVCSFRAETEMTTEELLRDIRRYLPEDVGAISLEEAPPRFHARLSCKRKTYCYRVWNSEAPCVFARRLVAAEPEPLDLEAMRRAAGTLLGEHDFKAFCGNKHMKKSTVRRLERIEIEKEGEELRLYFTGDGFLMHMVRILTGTLLEVGRGEREEDLSYLLAPADRSRAGFLAPARGLILWDEEY